MANRRQSIKKIRVDKRRREHNIRVRSELKTVLRNVRETLAAKKKTEASEAFRTLASKLDKAVKKKAIPSNRASRIKSRIQRKVFALSTAKSSK